MNEDWNGLSRKEKNEILAHYDVLVTSDNKTFQERARLLQAVWRENQSLERASDNESSPGCRLAMPNAEKYLTNFLTKNIQEVVRCELKENKKRPKQDQGFYAKPRIYNNLLSSQPLCFNLFGELKHALDLATKHDLDLATKVFGTLTDSRIERVEEIKFEYSPGREDPKYTGDKSAFDVYVLYKPRHGEKGFVGIEVKYHENPKKRTYKKDPSSQKYILVEPEYYNNHGKRYDCIAHQMNCFQQTRLKDIQGQPIQQFWRDHLLVGAHQIVNQFDDAFFAIMYPKDNQVCEEAVFNYRDCLSNCESFRVWTMEDFVKCLRLYSSAGWIDNFYSRYLDFERLPTSVPCK